MVLKSFEEKNKGVKVDVVIEKRRKMRKRMDERRIDVKMVNI